MAASYAAILQLVPSLEQDQPHAKIENYNNIRRNSNNFYFNNGNNGGNGVSMILNVLKSIDFLGLFSNLYNAANAATPIRRNDNIIYPALSLPNYNMLYARPIPMMYQRYYRTRNYNLPYQLYKRL